MTLKSGTFFREALRQLGAKRQGAYPPRRPRYEGLTDMARVNGYGVLPTLA